MTKCVVCGKEGETEDHHTSYIKNTKVPVCKKCHINIHSGKIRPDLKPTDKPSDLASIYMKTNKECRENIRKLVYQMACANEDEFLNKLIDITIDVTADELIAEQPNHNWGRHKKPIDTKKIITLRNSSNPPMSYAKIARELDCSVGTILNRLKADGVYTPMFKKLPRDGLEAHHD